MARTGGPSSPKSSIGARLHATPRVRKARFSSPEPSPPVKATRSAKSTTVKRARRGVQGGRVSKAVKAAVLGAVFNLITSRQVTKRGVGHTSILTQIKSRDSSISKDDILRAKHALVDEGVLERGQAEGATITVAKEAREELADFKGKKTPDSDDDEAAAEEYLEQNAPAAATKTKRSRPKKVAKSRSTCKKPAKTVRLDVSASDDEDDAGEEVDELASLDEEPKKKKARKQKAPKRKGLTRLKKDDLIEKARVRKERLSRFELVSDSEGEEGDVDHGPLDGPAPNGDDLGGLEDFGDGGAFDDFDNDAAGAALDEQPQVGTSDDVQPDLASGAAPADVTDEAQRWGVPPPPGPPPKRQASVEPLQPPKAPVRPAALTAVPRGTSAKPTFYIDVPPARHPAIRKPSGFESGEGDFSADFPRLDFDGEITTELHDGRPAPSGATKTSPTSREDGGLSPYSPASPSHKGKERAFTPPFQLPASSSSPRRSDGPRLDSSRQATTEPSSPFNPLTSPTVATFRTPYPSAKAFELAQARIRELEEKLQQLEVVQQGKAAANEEIDILVLRCQDFATREETMREEAARLQYKAAAGQAASRGGIRLLEFAGSDAAESNKKVEESEKEKKELQEKLDASEAAYDDLLSSDKQAQEARVDAARELEQCKANGALKAKLLAEAQAREGEVQRLLEAERKKTVELQAQLEQTEGGVKRTTEERESLRSELAVVRENVAVKEKELEAMQQVINETTQQRDSTATRLAKVEGMLHTAEAAKKAAEEDLSKEKQLHAITRSGLQSKLDRLRGELKDAQTALATSSSTTTRLEEDNKGLSENIADLDKKLKDVEEDAKAKVDQLEQTKREHSSTVEELSSLKSAHQAVASAVNDLRTTFGLEALPAAHEGSVDELIAILAQLSAQLEARDAVVVQHVEQLAAKDDLVQLSLKHTVKILSLLPSTEQEREDEGLTAASLPDRLAIVANRLDQFKRGAESTTSNLADTGTALITASETLERLQTELLELYKECGLNDVDAADDPPLVDLLKCIKDYVTTQGGELTAVQAIAETLNKEVDDKEGMKTALRQKESFILELNAVNADLLAKLSSAEGFRRRISQVVAEDSSAGAPPASQLSEQSAPTSSG
ncbi:hypothetical protein JCM10207_008362 [Rhodosporidiobolus poonsookiae]